MKMGMVERARLEHVVREYFDGCNEADRAKMLRCLAPDAKHYFPLGAQQGPFLSASEIATGWINAVATLGSTWTVDRLVIDEEKREVAMEWTHWKTRLGVHLRGAELYCFDDDGLITEIRAYYAAPLADPQVDAVLGRFDYRDAGYPMSPP